MGVVQLSKNNNFASTKLYSEIKGDISGWWGKTYRKFWDSGIAINSEAKNISILDIKGDGRKRYEFLSIFKNEKTAIWDHVTFGKNKDSIVGVEHGGIFHYAKIELKKRKILFRNKQDFITSGELTTLAVCPKGKFLFYQTRQSILAGVLGVLEIESNKLKVITNLEVKHFSEGYYKSMICYGYFGSKVILLGFDGIKPVTTVIPFSFDLETYQLSCLKDLIFKVDCNWVNIVQHIEGEEGVFFGGDFGVLVQIIIRRLEGRET